MNRKNLFFISLILIFTGHPFGSVVGEESRLIKSAQQDPLRENQLLYNGKAWRNLFTNVKGDQFLFSNEFLPASVSINGKSFKNLNINYDIFNDEIITPKNNGTIIQLNKEMVDSFTLVYSLKTYYFRNTQDDSLPGIKGFVNVLYHGNSALYIKFKKEIQLLAVDDRYDLFFQTQRIYFIKNGTVYPISGKRDLFKALPETKARLKEFMKKNGLKISKKEPESFIPVIRYYDSLSK
jgi:hypothetical protein